MHRPQSLLTLVVFIIVCLSFGSVYLVNRIAINTIPPLPMAGTRYLISGILLFSVSRFRWGQHFTRKRWRWAIILGGLNCIGSAGPVVWAQQMVPVGLTSLLMAITPMYVVLLDWLRPGGIRPKLPVVAGILLSFAGIFLLVGPSSITGSAIAPAGVAALIFAGICNACLALLMPRAAVPSSSIVAMAMQMTSGGALLLLVGGIAGDFGRLSTTVVSISSVYALAYLVVIGAVAFTGYFWLLRTTSPTLVSSIIAYSGPVLSIFLGWAALSERLTAQILVGAAVIIGGLVLVMRDRPQTHARPVPAERLTPSPRIERERL